MFPLPFRKRALTPVLALALAITLAACASTPAPQARLGLKLAPAALGAELSVQQHLRVERGGRVDELDAALEVDAGQLQLVGLAFGQRVLSLRYDGRELTSWRHPMLPAQVRADDVLEDLQLTLWPAPAIAAALPPGWRIDEREGEGGRGLRRTVYMGNDAVVVIDYAGLPRWSGTVVLDNLRYRYRLTVETAPANP